MLKERRWVGLLPHRSRTIPMKMHQFGANPKKQEAMSRYALNYVYMCI